MARYCIPSRMMASSVVNRPTAAWGNRLTSKNRTTATASPARMAAAAIFRIGPACRLPQYWLQKMTSPSPRASRSCWWTNWIWLTAVTPDRAASL